MNDIVRLEVPPGFVELQLLRHGPPHNQLLSPLTEYLALCGDHPNTTLRIPLEHAALETRLRALRYVDSEATRIDQLRETARIAAELLAQVPGLIADLASTRADGKPFVHLSIASRAAELALFPFELAVSPDGFPGAGQPLCLQKQLPVCLTRRSRNVRNKNFNWNREVKILMIASAAGGDIPFDEHYSLLRKLVEPWAAVMQSHDRETRQRHRGRVLRVLADATIDKIERFLCDEVAETGVPFSHIHVLAHGCDLPETDRRTGVAFNRPYGASGIDAVDGRRLAAALGCLPDYPTSSKHLRGPTVVTLATCSSGDQGGVIVPGASLAFELHDSGIPLVVGSQFPLTVAGSIVMTEALYRGFLAGRDPRSTVWDARRALQSNLPESPARSDAAVRASHDWASLTVYAAFPDDIDAVLPEHRRTQQRMRMDRRLRNMDDLLKKFDDLRSRFNYQTRTGTGTGTGTGAARMQDAARNLEELPDALREALRNADKAIRKFEKWVGRRRGDDVKAEVDNHGILASAQKQVALLFLRLASFNPPLTDSEEIQRWTRRGEKLLRKSRETYWSIFGTSRDETWALVQAMALNFCLHHDFDWGKWIMGRHLALLEEHSPDLKRRIWALGALIELQFLEWLKGEKEEGDTDLEVTADRARQLRDLFPKAPREVYSAKRQFERYVNDFHALVIAGVGAQDIRDYDTRLEKRMAISDAAAEGDFLGPAMEKIRDIIRILDDLEFSE